ncbi:MAG: acetate/propionate family kinase [Thermoleophilia bacterium]|nr:acetate/propionate family kinase [Thermoleophilia bacterium]
MAHSGTNKARADSQGTQTILCINTGSSSIKFHLYEMGSPACGPGKCEPGGCKPGKREPGEGSLSSSALRAIRASALGCEELLAKGAVEGVGQEHGRLWFVDAQGQPLADKSLFRVDQDQAVCEALRVLSAGGLPSIEAVGHRIVHGGPKRFAPEIVTEELLAYLRAHSAWAPLHIPASIRVMETLRREQPDLPQVACFDTAFHARMPEVARRLPLPRELYERGVYKYGFHGLSYEYLLGALGEQAQGKLIMAHLGNGASMVACRDGVPLDTTMGMTPLGGIMMGTRAGDLDPGVLIYLLREANLNAESLEKLLAKDSGLKGVSGETSDMKTLLELRAQGNAEASLAVEMFAYIARKAVGALAAVLGGLDCLVFTGGIGENAAAVRALLCEGLDYLGVRLDPRKNAHGETVISSDDSSCLVMVIPTNEEIVIARHTFALLFGSRSSLKEGTL